MCGLAGFFGTFDGSLLKQMSSLIAHRGPDDKGIFRDPDNGIGLVHQRLSIQDLSPAGHQPMWTKDDSVCIVFNGEIYNFQELRTELEKDGYVFRSNSDTEVLLNLYLKEGENLLSKLNGILPLLFGIKELKNYFWQGMVLEQNHYITQRRIQDFFLLVRLKHYSFIQKCHENFLLRQYIVI